MLSIGLTLFGGTPGRMEVGSAAKIPLVVPKMTTARKPALQIKSLRFTVCSRLTMESQGPVFNLQSGNGGEVAVFGDDGAIAGHQSDSSELHIDLLHHAATDV